MNFNRNFQFHGKVLNNHLINALGMWHNIIKICSIMRVIGYIILVINTFWACTDKKDEWEYIREEYRTFKYGNEIIYISGINKNGKPNGNWYSNLNIYSFPIWTICYKNGKVISIRKNRFGGGTEWYCNYKNQQPHGGYSYKYSALGIPHIQGQYENGKKVGIWEYLWFDKKPWIKIDYGSLVKPKVDTLFHDKSLSPNFKQKLHEFQIGIAYRELNENRCFQEKLIKREKELMKYLNENNYKKYGLEDFNKKGWRIYEME